MSPILSIRYFSALYAAAIFVYCCQSTESALLNEDAAVGTLVSGLRANQNILKMFLPLPLQPPDASLSSIEFENHMIRFYGLLHSLTHIGERARETRALTLAGRQDDAELMTVQVVLQKLTENACSLLKLKVGDQTGCSYSELMTLKTKIDVLNTVMDEDPIAAYRRGDLGSVDSIGWLNSNVVCNLSPSSLSALNSIRLFGRPTNYFSQNHC